jgi:hypothetical protein
MGLWPFSSKSQNENDWTPIAGETPDAIGENFAHTVDTTDLSEADTLQAMRQHAEEWSDNPVEQGQYLFGLLRGLGKRG